MRRTFALMVLGWLLTGAALADAPDHGYLRVRGRQFVFDDGTVFVPRGLSVLGVTHLACREQFTQLWGLSPEAWLDALASAGVNFLRVHVMVHANGAGDLGIGCVPELRADHRQLIEQCLPWYLEQCQRRGIYVAVNVEHFAEFCPWWTSPYNAKKGGPCQTAREFATKPEAVALFRKRLDLYNQYTRYRSFALWELTNELWCEGVPTAEVGKDQAAIDWLAGLAKYVKQIDPVHHPIGTSLNGGADNLDDPAFQAIQGGPDIDWVSVHSYDVSFVSQARHPWLLASGKPILSTETYNLGKDFENARNRTWEGLALGSCELEWSSGFMLDREGWDQDLRTGFGGMLAVLKAAAAVARETVEADRWSKLEPVALTGAVASTDGRHLMAWFTQTIAGTRVTLAGLTPGTYRVEWFNPVTGAGSPRKQVRMAPGAYVTAPGGAAFLYVRPL